MGKRQWLILAGAVLLFAFVPRLHSDMVEMQNGDRYFGKVLSMSADSVVLESEVLGKIHVPRKKVASLLFAPGAESLKPGTNDARLSAFTNLPAFVPATAPAGTNGQVAAALRQLGANTNLIAQVRQQMFAGNPEAAGKFDELVTGLMTGQLTLEDLRRQAKESADQLRALKRELGPEVGDSLDAYMSVLDGFLKETAAEPAKPAHASSPKVSPP